MQKINGNISSIRRSYIERLESIYDMEIDRREFCTVEMLDALAFFTEATGREAMVYLDRAGRILAIAVGEQDRVSLPLLKTRRSEERLSGIRCIHTHPGGNSRLSEVDVQSLKKMRFDAMAAVGVKDGKPVSMQVGILNEIADNGEFSVNLFGLYKIRSIPDEILWNEIEAADNRIRAAKSKKAGAETARAILVGVVGSDAGIALLGEPLKELSQLADTAGFITVGQVTQPRLKPDKSYYLGSGRLHDLVLEIQRLSADTVIFDDELSPAQIRNIQKELGKTEIMDRTSLILDIFSGRASTHEGRLQVELAETKYMLPRMTGFWTHMSRMGGGGSSGTGGGAHRGEGETQLEVDRRILRKRLHDLEKEIDKIKSRRDVQRVARERSKIPIVAFVGYTNAGKSTLMNHLSGSNVLAEDKLFATLDPVSRRVSFGCGELLLVDTVGFINKLPHDLVDAFRATLEEAKHADLLLHVVDSSSPESEAQMKTVSEVLVQLDAGHKPILTVYNKCDVSGETVSERNSVCVSAKTGTGMEELKKTVIQKLAETRIEISVLLPLGSGSLVSRVYANGQVTGCEYLETGIKIKAAVNLEDASRLRAEALEIYR
ncbi:MAG: GTPase HflX [Oscillospiraceae bacterium]|jgi:GTP-binding protein HflX|nr:GTPase HflX [Oscillospiraceae bacterium]